MPLHEISAGRDSGFEIDYAQITSNVSVTSTTQASPNDVVSLGARIYDGATIIVVEFFAFGCQSPTTAGNILVVDLWDDSTDLGRWVQMQTPASAVAGCPLFGRWRLTPSAGSHTYKARAWRNGTVNATILADQAPSFIRVIRA